VKRSEINKIIDESIKFLDSQNFKLPPWGYWSLEQWKQNSGIIKEIVDNMLGWDLTDFGSGDIFKTGIIIFTVRNGNQTDKSYIKPYCEKVLLIFGKQVCPMHFHWSKMEDIINRGGGNLVVELYNSTENEGFSQEPVTVGIYGIKRTVNAGGKVVLKPGESITLERGIYHSFWSEKDTDNLLLGEVSTVNDDTRDNRFYSVAGRFPDIVEDVPPQYLLAIDYKILVNLIEFSN
jgi:D-lyxose ketol-isomerase